MAKKARFTQRNAIPALADIFREIKQGKHIFVGITGGIGTGKSSVAELIRAAGHPVLHSDAIARELMQSRVEIREEIAQVLGPNMLREDGGIATEALAAKVFAATPEGAEALSRLNAIVHPYVIEALAEGIRAEFEKGTYCVFNETALLYEVGLQEVYDYVIVVDAPDEIRIERLMHSRGMSEEDIRQRMARQKSQQHKKQAADFVIDNGGSSEDLERAVNSLMVFLPYLKPRGPEEEE